MSVLEFYLCKSILGFNFPLFYLIFFSTEFFTPHPDLKLILGHCAWHAKRPIPLTHEEKMPPRCGARRLALSGRRGAT